MRYNRVLLLLIPAISAIFLTTNYNVSFASDVQSLSQISDPIMQSADDGIVMQPIEDSTEQYIEVPVEFCDDGLDNDDDGKVDEECGAATFSSACICANDLINGEEKIQNEEYEHSDDESNEDYEEKEHEDKE